MVHKKLFEGDMELVANLERVFGGCYEYFGNSFFRPFVYQLWILPAGREWGAFIRIMIHQKRRENFYVTSHITRSLGRAAASPLLFSIGIRRI